MKKQPRGEVKQNSRSNPEAILLPISEAVSLIKEREELLSLIVDKVQPIFGFNQYTSIVVLTKDKTRFDQFFTKINTANVINGGVNDLLNEITAEGILEPILLSPEPIWLGIDRIDSTKHIGIDSNLEKLWNDCGIKCSLNYRLQCRGNIIGTWCVHFESERVLDVYEFSLFKALGNLIAIAVSNILNYEEISDREKERDTLFRVSNDIAKIFNRNQLFDAIINTIKPVFSCSETAVFIIDKDRKHYRMWYNSLSTEYEDGTKSKTGEPIPMENNPVADDVFLQPIHIINKHDMITVGANSPSIIKWLQESGIEEALICPLIVGGVIIGCFNCHSTAQGVFKPEKFYLYQSIADQMAVAIANIQANEEILEKDKEKSELLAISQQMATIRKIDDLLTIITQKLKPVFLFDYSVTTVYSEDKKFVRHLSSNGSEEEKQTENYQLLFNKANTVEGTPYEVFLENEFPTIYTVDYYLHKYPSHAGVKILQDLGIVENVIMTLQYAGKILGTLEFHYCKTGILQSSQIPILQNLSNQVSVALSNILANDEILNREQEKAVLLSLSEDMATIRNRQDLWHVMMDKIKPLVGFDDAVVIVFSADRTSSNTILTLSSVERSQKDWYQYIIEKWIPNSEPLNYIYNLDTGYWSTVDILNRWPEFEGCKFMLSEGLTDTYQIILSQGGNQIGLLLLHFKSKELIVESKYDLYKSLADQIAVAIANIMANEEILERENEKEILLGVSRSLTAVRNREELFEVFLPQLKAILSFDDAVLTFYDASLKTRRYAHAYSGSPVVNKDSYQLLHSTNVENAGTPYEEILGFKRPEIRQMNYWIKKYAKDPGVKIAIEFGLKQSLYLPLYYADRLLGTFTLHSNTLNNYKADRLPLYQSLSAQVAAAVANILANEEIIEREREKSVLLSLSNDFATVNDRDDLFKMVSQKVLPLFNCNDIVVFVADREKDIYYLLLAIAKSNRYQNEFYQSLISKVLPLKGSLEEWIIEQKKVKIIPFTEFEALFPNAPGIKLMQQVGLKDSLIGVLKAGGRVIGSLHLHSENENHFTESNLQLFESVCDQLSSTIANILANEEILEREKEKTVLLKISSQLSLVNDRKELWALISRTLKEIICFNVGIVATLDPDGRSFRILLSTAPTDMDNNPEYLELGTKPELLDGSPFENIFKREGVFQFSLIELETIYPDYLGLKMMREYGLLHTVGIRLSKGSEFIGQMFLHFNKIEDIDHTKFGLLKSIGEQLSIVVANILANEQIQEREREKSLQIEVVNAITSTKDKNRAFLNLANIIDKVIPFHTFSIAFPFDIHYLFGFKKDKNGQLVEWNNVQEIMDYANIDENEYQDLLSEIALAGYFSSAHIWVGKEHDAQCKRFKISALHHELIGTRSALHLPFLFHGQNIKVHIYMNSQDEYGFTEKDLNLLQTMVSPLSLAMENLFAFEEIAKREQEKSILLNLSNAINNIKDKQDLWEEIVNQLHPVFGFEPNFTFIYLITPDKLHYRFFLLNKSAISDQALAFKDIYRNEFLIKGAPYEQVVKRDVWIFAIEDMVDSYPNFEGFKHGLQSGQRQTAIVRLEYGGIVIGSLHLNARHVNCFNETHIPLLKAIGKQVSIAVANILASDEIENQLREITALKKQIEAENEYLQEAVDQVYNYTEIIGTSKAMQNVYHLVSQVAFTDSTVLILGETGTGKELIARAIHNSSNRKDKILVKVNCASLPANLIESELFGHERGSFTGAFERRIGKFELANNGTLFLDEIGELPIELQAKLLRALQEKEIERIGGKTVIKCDVRIIAATNRKLEEEVKAQRFRSDLFFRLNIFPIHLPSLKDRKEDIPLLANHFLKKFSAKMNKKIIGIDNDTLQTMMIYHWPGNIRELENLIERAVIINKTKILHIGIGDLIQQNSDSEIAQPSATIFQVKSYKDAERELILKTLEIANGKIRGEGGAAQLLKINPTTLESKMKKLGLVKKSKIEVVEE